MNRNTADTAAEHTLSLMPLFFHKILRAGHGTSFFGARAAQVRVLHLVHHNGTRQMSEIGKWLYISKPYMTVLVDSMVAEGLVERRPDLNDRRIVLIAITKKGEKHLSASISALKRDLKKRLSALDSRDLQKLVQSLDCVRSVLERIE